MKISPIVLFVYNRPWHTQKTVEALRNNYLAKESKLFIFSDGSKNKKDENKVNAVRQYINSIAGFKSVKITQRNSHLGLAKSVIDGVSEIINKYKKVIVLEDDLVSSPNFLQFLNSALDFYKDNKHIYSVTGYCYPIEIPLSYKLPVYIYYRCSSWGWGTWVNRWEKVDWKIKDYSKFQKDESAQLNFNKGGEDLSDMLVFQMRGKLDSWAIRWCYAHYKNSAYCLYPTVSKIRNIGLDGSGTHRSFRSINIKLDKSNENIKFPRKIYLNEDITSALSEHFKKDIIRKIVFKLKKLYK